MINQMHLAAGLFKVEFYSWDDIVEILDQFPGAVVQQLYGRPTDVAPAQPVQPALRVEIVGAAGDSSLDAEIDEAKRLIESYQHETARLLLERIKNRQWGNLTSWQKFRVVSNLGATFFGEGQFEKAAQFYLEAKDFQPDNEQALANEALAYHLLGDSPKAFELACSLIERLPNSKRPYSIWLNAAPVSMSIEALEKKVPEQLKEDGEICLALAHRALVGKELQKAERFARKASQAIPEHPLAWLLLAQIQVRREYIRIASSLNLFQEVDLTLCREAEGYLTKAIELAKAQRSSVLVDALIERAELRHLMGDGPGREQDLGAALSLAPDRASVNRAYAGLLVSRRDFTGAIDLLRAIKGSGQDGGVDLLLAATLRDRNQPGDLAEAAELFSNFLKADQLASPGVRRLAIGSAVECLQGLGRPDAAVKLIEEQPCDSVPECFRLALSGQVQLAAGNTQAASEVASRALQLARTSDSPEDIRLIASLLSGLGRYDEACTLWQQLKSPGKWALETKNLLDCLSRLKRDREALELCRELREAGVEDASLREYELDLLEKYDTPEAIRVLQDWLTRRPEDRLSRVRLSLIGLRLDRPELIAADPEALPPVDAVSARVGRAVVQVLQMGGRPDEALRYGYELLRRHFHDPDAHIAYISTLLPLGPAPFVPEPKEVCAGTAVSYVEESHSDERWIVIEDSRNPDIGRAEYPEEHPLAQRLLGKKPGEMFVLAEGTVQSRTATVRQVLSKYVYRFRDCMAEWQLRFPSVRAIESVAVTKRTEEQETYDLSVVEKSIEQRNRAFDELLNQYRSSIMPLHAFAEQLGRSLFDLVGALAQQPEIEIRCCNGSATERDAAFAAMDSAEAVVLEASALATLGLLENPALLSGFPGELVVSQGTVNALRELVSEVAMQSGKGGYIVKDETGLALIEETEEKKRDRIGRLRRFVASVESRCRVEVCTEVAALPPDRRKVLAGVFGHHGTESILLARSNRRVLWTDDWVVAGFAVGEYGVRRAWTQAALGWAATRKGLNANHFQEASAKLIGWGYSFSGLNVGILVKCGILANWGPDRWPLKQALDRLQDLANGSQDVLLVSAGFIVQLYRECFLPPLRHAVIIRVMERLLARPGGVRVIDALHRALHRLFWLDALGATDADTVIRSWRRARGLQV